MLTECRVFLRELGKCLRHLALSDFRLGLDGKLDDRLREFHGFQYDRVSLVAERVACRCKLQPDRSGNITGVDLFQFSSLVGVHLEHTSESFLLVLGGIEHIGPGRSDSGIDAEERELSYEGICHDLEGQCREGLLVRGVPQHFVSVRINALDRRDVAG